MRDGFSRNSNDRVTLANRAKSADGAKDNWEIGTYMMITMC